MLNSSPHFLHSATFPLWAFWFFYSCSWEWIIFARLFVLASPEGGSKDVRLLMDHFFKGCSIWFFGKQNINLIEARTAKETEERELHFTPSSGDFSTYLHHTSEISPLSEERALSEISNLLASCDWKVPEKLSWVGKCWRKKVLLDFDMMTSTLL